MIDHPFAVCVAVVGASLLFGCASTPDDKDAEARTEKVYRTGSNIPVRDSSARSEGKTMSADDFERMRELQDRMRGRPQQ